MATSGLETANPGRFNSLAWAKGRFIKAYANRQLRPAEVVVFVRYREGITGRVLDLGSGAGRIAGYLIDLGADLTGLDVSADMVATCRSRYPGGTFLEGDILDLSRFEDGSFDAVLATCNLLDVFPDADRRHVLREVRRVLAPDGLFVMSSHNRAHLPQVTGPAHVRTSDPLRFAADLVRAPRRVLRHRALVRYERDEPGYAIVSDGAHEYSFVHYFISADAQRAQFEEEGLRLLEVLDLDGRPLAAGDAAPDFVELHYVSRRA